MIPDHFLCVLNQHLGDCKAWTVGDGKYNGIDSFHKPTQM